jgi:galactose-1-phosphate uridylyltransferase
VSIQFEKTTEKVEFHSPLVGMQKVTQRIERRCDPLTGRWSILAGSLQDKAATIYGPSDYSLMDQLAKKSRPGCFFCPERVEKMTPRFAEEWLAGGCIKKGECFLFPNLFPIGAVHAVIAVGHQHHRLLDDFPSLLIKDAFSAAVEFMGSVHRADNRIRYFSLNGNHHLPAGASVLHPHYQILGGRYPQTAAIELVQCCAHFRQTRQAEYFKQLIKVEQKQGERYIGACGSSHWMAAFAPKGTCEILGVLPDCPSFAHATEKDLGDLAQGLSRVLAHYHGLGFSSYNFSVFSSSLNEPNHDFPVFIRVICRQNVYENYRADDYFLQKLLGEEIVVFSPEALAAGLKQSFHDGRI